jgi:pimeloyl-ACP methyl ester carboxylesterase
MSRFDVLGIQHEVQLAQGTIRYRECGSGEPLVFVHGLLVNGDIWRKVVPLLAKNYRCIVPDLPLGSHEIPLAASADLTPPGLARLIVDFLDALELPAVTLIANDTGGALCQLLIAANPDRLKRLVLTNCDAYENFPPPQFRYLQWGAYIPGFVFLLGRFLQLGSVPYSPIAYGRLAKYPMERAVMQSYIRPIAVSRGIRRDLGKAFRGIANRYTVAAARTFSTFDRPVLLAWADEDFFFLKKYAQRLGQDFPHAQVEYIHDSYTFVPEDQPGRLVELIEVFMHAPVATLK